LWDAWTNKTLPDTSRLNALYRYAWDGYLNSNPDSALYFFTVYRTYAEKRDLRANISQGLTAEGIVLNRLGDIEAALKKYRRSISIAKDLKNYWQMLRPLSNMGVIHKQRGEFEIALQIYEESLNIAKRIGDHLTVGALLSNIGNVHREKGEYQLSLNFHERALQIRDSLGDQSGIANTFGNLGAVYVEQGAHDKDIELFFKSLAICERTDDKRNSAGMLLNIGIVYTYQKSTAKAMEYFQRGLLIAREMDEPALIANFLESMATTLLEENAFERALELAQEGLRFQRALGSKDGEAALLLTCGNIVKKFPDYPEAMMYYRQAFQIFDTIGSAHGVAMSRLSMAEVFLQQERIQEACSNAEISLNMAQNIGAIEVSKNASELLYRIYKKQGRAWQALEMHELHVTLEDSIERDENKRVVMQQQFQYEYDKREALLVAEQEKKDAVATEGIKRKEQQRNALILGLMLTLGLAGVSYRSYRIKKQDNLIISQEKARSEELLLNILPAEVADELKAKGAADAKLIDEVTVLFTDFKGFTQLSEKLTPKELVGEIHECFSAFDSIMQKYGVEKIKTIGDAYMAAGGLPEPNSTHAKDVVNAALEIQAFMQEHKHKRETKGELFFEIRIGVHTGPVVAGIVGIKKFQYDIWGDTVNTASRMESSGEVGKVNVSQETYNRIKNDFDCHYRGKVEAKGKGMMGMWFIAT